MNVFVTPAYEVQKIPAETGMAVLKSIFPDGEANDLNFCLFSTSGTHGSYLSIEDVAASLRSEEPKELTVLVIQPRTVRMLYGSIAVQTDDIPYLIRLRESSRRIAAKL